MTLINASGKEKKRLHRYQRLFQLQHWWRIIHYRHREKVAGKSHHLIKAFAAFLIGGNASDHGIESIREDFTVLNRRLGRNWVQKYNVLAHF
jgi:hypothetical protein